MSRSPDSELTATPTSPPSLSSCIREKASPTTFISRNKSPVSDVILKGSPSAFPSYPIVIPTIRRVPPSPDCRRSRSPLHSCIPVMVISNVIMGLDVSSASFVCVPLESKDYIEIRRTAEYKNLTETQTLSPEQFSLLLYIIIIIIVHTGKTCREETQSQLLW
jgi:hypothetical protein